MTPAALGGTPVDVHTIDEYVHTDLGYLSLLGRPRRNVRHQHPHRKAAIELGAQPGDMDLDDIGPRIEPQSPDRSEQFLAAHRAPAAW